MSEILDKLRLDLRDLEKGARWATMESGKVYAMLIGSECYLLDAYYESTKGTAPPCDSTDGVIELGPVLYWLNNPSATKHPELIKVIVGFLEALEGAPLPPSKIKSQLWCDILSQVETDGIVAKDGTIYGESRYEQLDPGWLESLALFLWYQYHHSEVHRFGHKPQRIRLSPGTQSITIGVVGDWGTGSYGPDKGPAPKVMTDLQGLKPRPDYLIHLGDVYYAGTEDQEQDNLLDGWPEAWGAGKKNAFTLNSNHEMYDGANGYFKTALAAAGPFDCQAGTSYFALEYGDWVILGLDSAYLAAPDHMFMTGSIGSSEDPQAEWIRKHFSESKGANVIVMTHHNPMNTTGTRLAGKGPPESETQLWSVVKEALGGPPAYWYYGHIHNGVVYSEKSVLGKQGKQGTKARLCGHGAIPFGKGWGIEEPGNPGVVDYYAHTPMPGSKVQVQNGFATIELTPCGGITETFYELSGNPGQPAKVWTS